MPDLVEKYFMQDLTDEEDRALTQELLNSDQASEKFLRLAEEAYARFGLPPADWEGPPPRILSKPKTGWHPWLGLSLVVLGMAAGLHYWRSSNPWASLIQTLGQNRAASAAPRLDAPQPQAANRPAAGEGRPSVSNPPPGADPAGTVASIAMPVSNPKGVGSPGSSAVGSPIPPANPSQAASPAFSKLSVDVSVSGPETLTVRVLNPHGIQVAFLYEGPVASGKWTFTWNGKISDGGLAPPGYYQIEMKSGNQTQRRNVRIR